MKSSLFNSNTSHLNLYPQSDCLFSFDNVSSAAIRNYGGHAQWTITMSRILSHSATAWDNYIAAFLTVTKEETHVKGVFFAYFLSACVLMHSDDSQLCLVCVHSLITRLQLKENFRNVRVCA